MSVLNKIVDRKAERLAHAKSAVPIHEIKSRLRDADKTRDFASSIKGGRDTVKLIAELKKASPSKGVIRKDFDPVRIASIYEEKGAHAMSVLTEEDFFQGDLSFIRQVRGVTTVPLLRKDFIFDEYQLYESRVHGADAVLLIAAILDKNQADEYLSLAAELGLRVLFEVHDEYDLEKALGVDAHIIGINNRDLRTLQIDLATTFRLRKDIPEGKIVVSESGIRSREDAGRLMAAGIDAMLVGTSLMEAGDIGKAIDALMNRR